MHREKDEKAVAGKMMTVTSASPCAQEYIVYPLSLDYTRATE